MSDAEKTPSSLDAFKAVLHNPGLRRLQLAWAGSNLGTWGFGVAISVYAYDHGGAAAVGIVALLRLVPAAIAQPFTGALGDRHSRRLVMALSDLGRVVTVVVAALAVFASAPPWVVYTLTTIAVVISTAFRPAQAAAIPALATTPQELTASNVVSSTIESTGMFVGPAIAGLVLAVSGIAEVFLVAAATFLWSAALIYRIHGADAPERDDGDEVEEQSFLRQTFEGFGAVVKEPAPRLLVGLFGLQTLVAGAFIVFEVLIPLDLLGKGNAWVGVLGAVFGIGGIAGAFVSAMLVARDRLALNFGTGMFFWGAPLIAVGLWPTVPVVVVAMFVMGVGNTVVDVAGMTLLQRAVPDRLLSRVFGVLETTFLATIAIGAGVTPLLVRWLGGATTIAVVGVFLPVVVVIAWRSLMALDRKVRAPRPELALLRGISFFSPLPPPVLEHLSRRLQRRTVPAGEHVFEQGDSGDLFYVVEQGRVDIVKDGEMVTQVAPGGYFGEIALLHDVPRTAGAVAEVDTTLLGLEGEDFIAAVTGHAGSAEAAEAVVRSYGGGLNLSR